MNDPLVEIKGFLKSVGVDCLPLTDTNDSDRSALVQRLRGYFGRDIPAESDTFQAACVVQDMAKFYGIKSGPAPEPKPKSETLFKDQWVLRFRLVTGCNVKWLPLVRYVLDERNQGPEALWIKKP